MGFDAEKHAPILTAFKECGSRFVPPHSRIKRLDMQRQRQTERCLAHSEEIIYKGQRYNCHLSTYGSISVSRWVESNVISSHWRHIPDTASHQVRLKFRQRILDQAAAILANEEYWQTTQAA
jgi:hypothetical protein